MGTIKRRGTHSNIIYSTAVHIPNVVYSQSQGAAIISQAIFRLRIHCHERLALPYASKLSLRPGSRSYTPRDLRLKRRRLYLSSRSISFLARIELTYCRLRR